LLRNSTVSDMAEEYQTFGNTGYGFDSS
jgi:hypothetical protein